MTVRRTRPALACLAATTLALVAGCARTTPEPAEGGRAASYFGSTRAPSGDVFTYNNGAEPEYLDPGLMSGQPDGRVARTLFEGLVVPHPQTLEPLPGQAERWDISPDQRTYTFHLRRELKWTDGRPVTAMDFRWSWLRVLAPRTGSRYAGIMYAIDNAEAYNKGEITDSTRVGLAAPDESTLVVTLTHPTPYFLSETAFYTFLPVPRQSVERWGDRWTRPENIVSNGPFRLVEWRQNDRIVCDKNLQYWDAAAVRLQRVIALAVDDLSTSINLYKAGTTDWNPSGYLPAQYVPYIRHNADLRTAPYQALYYYSVNVTKPPLDNVWLRRALNEAIDRESIAKNLLRGTRRPYGNFVPLGYPGYRQPPGVRYDTERARADLARAGYPGGKGLPKIEILFNTSEDHRRIAEAIQAMWKRELGIEVGLSNQEWGSYLKATTGLEYQVARRSWIGDYLDPSTFLLAMRGGDGNNRTGWASPRYDGLLRRAEAERDPAVRMRLLEEAEVLLLSEAVILPIYHYTVIELVKPYVKGLETNPLDVHPFKYVWIDHHWDERPAMARAGR